MIFNRNGQLGKIVTSFPVMMGIFLVMILYVFMASSLSVVRGPIDKVYEGDMFMIDSDINLEILDLYFKLKEEGDSDFSLSVADLLMSNEKENNCLYIYENSDFPDKNLVLAMRYFSVSDRYVIESMPQIFLGREEKLERGLSDVSFTSFSLLGKEKFLASYVENGVIDGVSLNLGDERVKLNYYFGECLGGEDE